jgi:predicted nucleic acid-binding protein
MKTATPPVAPAIALPEVARAVQVAGQDGLAAIAELRSMLAFELHDVSVSLAARAAEIAAGCAIRGCDAIYVALAEHLQTELVTLDQQQRERGGQIVPTREP